MSSQLRNEGGSAKWHSCAKWAFRSCENFHRRRKEATKSFHSGGRFSQRMLGSCEIISQPGPFLQGPFLGCEISQTMLSPCF